MLTLSKPVVISAGAASTVMITQKPSIIIILLIFFILIETCGAVDIQFVVFSKLHVAKGVGCLS